MDNDLDCYKNIVKNDPLNEPALASLAQCYLENGDESSALEIFREYSGPNINGRFANYIYSLQLQNRYAEAFDLYDELIHTNSNWNRSEPYIYFFNRLKKFNSSNKNEKLIICRSDGIGDNIFFCSFLHDILKITDNITVVTLPRLVNILSKSFPSIRFISDYYTASKEQFDCVALMALLPRFALHSNNDLQTERQPSLYPLKKRSLQPSNKLTIGFAWGSTRPSDEDQSYIKDHKSIDLSEFLPLFCLPNTRFINLQHGDASGDLESFAKEHDLDNLITLDDLDTTNDIEGIIDTVDACDILITPSNTLAHFGGALHKKTYTILPYGHSPARLWFWHRSDDGKNIWYPTINTYEQYEEGDWSRPIQELIDDLKEGELV
jgi:hypothetical protein